jgi:predicted outer membrane protein
MGGADRACFAPDRRTFMQRRLVLTGLAAAVAGPAFAQTQQPAPIPVNPQPTGSHAGAAASGGSQSVSAQMAQGETQYLQQTLATGTVALQTSEIALQKAQNAKVKQFAGFERDEQSGLAEVLRSIQEPLATASGGAAAAAASGGSASAAASSGGPRAAATAPEIPADKAKMMEELQQAKAGAEFDRLYVQGQIQGHQELLQIQQRYLQTNSGNREMTNIAKLARGRIQEHIAHLQEIQKELRG